MGDSLYMLKMSHQFTYRLANVYFTKMSNISKFHPVNLKVIANNPFKQSLMCNEVKYQTKVSSDQARHLRRHPFVQRRHYSTTEIILFHQRNPPVGNKFNRLPLEPGNYYFVSIEGVCYVIIIFSFIYMNIVNILTISTVEGT